MKSILLPFLLLLNILHAQSGESADASNQAPPAQGELLPSQKEFLNLPEEKRAEFEKLFGKAIRLYNEKRIFESLDTIHEAEKIFSANSNLLNLRGSCYTEMRAFDKALAAFNEALEMEPKSASIRFNIGEVLFVTKQWQQSHDVFQQVLSEVPPQDMGLSRLTEFKILLCKVKLGQKEEASILAQKYDYKDDSPFHYCAQAVLAYEKNDPIEAEKWLARANRIFQSAIGSWQDTLVEAGYIKGLYGE